MASVILKDDGECLLEVSNMRLASLVEFVLEVAATRPGGAEMSAPLRQFWGESFPGINFELAARFPSLAERKFWAGCFFDLARRIFLRQIGNQGVSHWQSSAIADAYAIARELTRCVRTVEPDWRPATEDDLEAGSKSGQA